MSTAMEDEREVTPGRASGEEERLVVELAAFKEGIPPATVLLVPWGSVKSANGHFVMDEQAGQAVLAAFTAHGTDIPIDYEHQSLGGSYASPNGQAPAAGWIRSFQLIPPEESGEGQAGLFSEVEWTPAAQEKLAAREYRYLSPVVIIRKTDRRVVALHSAALTNKPAIVGMKPIINRQKQSPSGPEEMAGVEEHALRSSGTAHEHLEILRTHLGLPAETSEETVLIAAGERLTALMTELARRDALDRVSAAARSGKLVPAQEQWALSLALKDPAAFDEWLARAPQVVILGRTDPPPAVSAGPADRNREAAIARARAVFQSEPELALLTSEQAWTDEALREVGFEPSAAS